MSKYADNVLTSIWADPWFLARTPEAKTIYLWAISSSHRNDAGLFVVARRVIEMETGLTGDRFDTAVQDLGPALKYHEPTGTVWVRGSARRARNAGRVNIAKSCMAAVAACPHRPFAREFVERYIDTPWIAAAPAGQSSPSFTDLHATLTQGLGESRVTVADPDPKRDPVTHTRGSGEPLVQVRVQAPEEGSSENSGELHAQRPDSDKPPLTDAGTPADEILAILRTCRRLFVDDLNARFALENAVQAKGGWGQNDVEAAAHYAVSVAVDPTWRMTNIGSLMRHALEKVKADPNLAGPSSAADRGDELLVAALEGRSS